MTLLIYNLAHCTAQAIGFIVRRLNSPRKMWCCVCLGFFPVWVDFFPLAEVPGIRGTISL